MTKPIGKIHPVRVSVQNWIGFRINMRPFSRQAPKGPPNAIAETGKDDRVPFDSVRITLDPPLDPPHFIDCSVGFG